MSFVIFIGCHLRSEYGTKFGPIVKAEFLLRTVELRDRLWLFSGELGATIPQAVRYIEKSAVYSEFERLSLKFSIITPTTIIRIEMIFSEKMAMDRSTQRIVYSFLFFIWSQKEVCRAIAVHARATARFRQRHTAAGRAVQKSPSGFFPQPGLDG
jgi:hypothetical protein